MTHFVESFPVSAKLKERLKDHGFSCLEDFVGLTVQDITKEVEGIKKEDAAWISAYVREISDPTWAPPRPVTAYSLLRARISRPSCISTFSRALDDLLDGGVPLGSVTEICGAPGIGKTQLCVQLAVNALIPEVFDGVGGKFRVGNDESSADDDDDDCDNADKTSGVERKFGYKSATNQPEEEEVEDKDDDENDVDAEAGGEELTLSDKSVTNQPGKEQEEEEEEDENHDDAEAEDDERTLGYKSLANKQTSKDDDLSYVYVFDTEGSFVPRRIFEIAEATVDHFHRLADSLDVEEDRDAIEQARAMNARGLCDRILISRCLSLEELLAGVKHLRTIVQQRRVSLIIVDSLAMHFRQEIEDLTYRTRVLNGLIQDFMHIAVGSSYFLGSAIVLTNQMTTKIYSDRNKSSHLVPALGESWGHAPTHRLLLHSSLDGDRQGKMDRRATIFKSPSRPEQTASFHVTSGGIRDVADNDNDDGIDRSPTMDGSIDDLEHDEERSIAKKKPKLS